MKIFVQEVIDHLEPINKEARSVKQSANKNYLPPQKSFQNNYLKIRAPKTAAYYISPIEIGVFWLEIKCLKSATRLLNRVCVGRRGLDLSKEVLWISVCQRAAELPAAKLEVWKKILPRGRVQDQLTRARPSGIIFFQTSNFDGCPLTYRDPQYLFRKI